MTDFNLATYLEAIKQVALKNRVWYVASVILCFIAASVLLLFFKPTVKMDTTLLQNKERELKALELQSIAFQQLNAQQAKRIDMLMIKDSALIVEVKNTGTAIRNIKIQTNENIKRFDNYGSGDWAKYYSQLPEPER